MKSLPTQLSTRMRDEKIENAIRMREAQTPAEQKLAVICEGIAGRGTDRFGLQVPILGYILDVYFHGARLCVEADGGYHASRRTEDAIRDAALAREGVTTIRLRNDLILESPGVARAMIEREIRRLYKGAARNEALARKTQLERDLAKLRAKLNKPRLKQERLEKERRAMMKSPKGCLL